MAKPPPYSRQFALAIMSYLSAQEQELRVRGRVAVANDEAEAMLDYSHNQLPKMAVSAGLRIAVIVPCYNEATGVGRVVRDFRAVLPKGVVYVYDNNSTDGTAEHARAAGAVVRREPLQGKGNVIRRAFADVEADVYVLVDGDDTYDAAAMPEMLNMLLNEQLDMVNGKRISEAGDAYRHGHRFGNAVLTGIIGKLFGDSITDALSGYRVFSRRFVKSFPALARGFEIETELTVHALRLKMPVGEVPAAYRARRVGSSSKLRTYSDGILILRTILVLVKEELPLQFFSLAGLILLLTGFGLAVPVITEFARTGLVPRLPTAVLAMGLVLLSFLSQACGLILDSVARGRREIKRMAFLSVPAVGVPRARTGAPVAATPLRA